MSTRHYLFRKEGEPQRLSRRLIEGLVFGRDSIPQYAGTHQKVAAVTLENDGLKPVRILSTAGYIWEFDADGSVSEGLQRTLGEFMDSALDTPSSTEGTVVSLRPKLTKKLLEERHRWSLGQAEINRIIADIWPKQKSDRLQSAKGVSKKTPPLTYDARHPLDEASAQFWKIGSALDGLKEPSLKGLIFEARFRSQHDPDHGFLYGAVVEMAEYRLELMRRHRVGKGVWYALVSVIMWNDGVGTSLARYHEACTGKQAALAAARRLLAEHAGEFGENITVEAEVLTDLEWQGQSHYHK